MTARHVVPLLALLLLATPSCKKSEENAEKKPEAEANAGKTGEEPGKDEAKPKKGEPVALPKLGAVSIDQAVEAMGADAPHRLVLRAKALAGSGLVELAMSAVPDAQKAKLDKFVAATGFDPVERMSGAVIYAAGDISEFERANATLVFGFSGGITEKFIEELDKLGDDDDDDDDDEAQTFRLVVLTEIPAPAQAKFIEKMSETKPGKPAVETEKSGDGTILAMKEEGALKYGYVWGSGLILGEMEKSSEPTLAAAKAALAPLMGELVKVAAAKAQPGGDAISGRGSNKGIAAVFAVKVTDKVLVNTTVTPPASELKKVEQFLAALPMVRAQPEKALGNLPPDARALAKLALDGLDMKIEGGKVIAELSMDLAKLKSMAKPLIEKNKKK